MLRPAPSQGAEGDDHNFPAQPIMDSVMSMLTRIPTRNSEVISKQNSSDQKSKKSDYETSCDVMNHLVRINKYTFVIITTVL